MWSPSIHENSFITKSICDWTNVNLDCCSLISSYSGSFCCTIYKDENKNFWLVNPSFERNKHDSNSNVNMSRREVQTCVDTEKGYDIINRYFVDSPNRKLLIDILLQSLNDWNSSTEAANFNILMFNCGYLSKSRRYIFHPIF